MPGFHRPSLETENKGIRFKKKKKIDGCRQRIRFKIKNTNSR